MIEAVKSTVANSALLRGNVDQSSTLNSFAANPAKIQAVSQAPYVSPTVRVDVNTKIAILEFRESVSGEVLAQIPTEQAIRTYKLREAREHAAEIAALTKHTSDTPSIRTAESSTGARQESTPAPQPTATSQDTPIVSEVALAAQIDV